MSVRGKVDVELLFFFLLSKSCELLSTNKSMLVADLGTNNHSRARVIDVAKLVFN